MFSNVGRLLGVGQRRHVAGRSQPADVAGQYKQIHPAYERGQVRPEAERQDAGPHRGRLTFPHLEVNIAEIKDPHRRAMRQRRPISLGSRRSIQLLA